MSRAFILIRTEEPLSCIGDTDGNGVVNVFDILNLLGQWGTCPQGRPCTADFDGSGTVDVFDLLALLGNWGECPKNSTGGSIPSREDETSAVGINEQKWSDFLDVLENGTELEGERWRCWFERRITQCQTCKSCRGSDPFAN